MGDLIKVFENEEFGKVRVILIGNNPWMVGKDVAEALGYERGSKAVQDHVDTEDKDAIPIQDSIGRMQSTPVINESGMYSLVFGSKLPTAKKFKHWVTSEILPAIRKNGTYSLDTKIPKTLPEALRAYADEVEAHEETKVKLVEAKTTIEEQKPKVEFADQVASTKDCIDVGTLAKAVRDENICIGRNKLFKWLKDNKYLMENNVAYQDKIDKGLFKTIIVTKNTMYGIKEYPKTLVTGRGQLMLVEKLREEFGMGEPAVIE